MGFARDPSKRGATSGLSRCEFEPRKRLGKLGKMVQEGVGGE
jgi:hypothetical protein